MHTCLCRNLSDVDNDGNLTTEEFVLAMFLVDLAKTGQPLPAKLPPELVPPSYRRGRSGSAVSVGVAPVQMTSPPGQVLPGTQPVPAPPGKAAGVDMSTWLKYVRRKLNLKPSMTVFLSHCHPCPNTRWCISGGRFGTQTRKKEHVLKILF